MAKRMDKITEYEVAFIAMLIASNNTNGEVTYDEIIEKLPNIVHLSDEDTKKNPNRPNQQMWEQRARNPKCHAYIEKNFVNRGYLDYVRRSTYRITPTGRKFLKDNMTQFTKTIYTTQP